MSILLTCIGDIMSFTAGFFFYRCVCCFLRPRKNILLFLMQWIGLSAVSGMPIYPNDVANITMPLLLFIAINLLLFEGELLVKLAIAVLFYPIAATVSFLYMNVGTLIYFSIFPEDEGMGSDIMATATYALVILFWYLFYRLLSPSLAKMKLALDNRAWIMVTIISLASFTALFSCVYFTPRVTYYVWPCLIACLITNIGCIRLSSSYMADGIYADIERSNLRLQQNYYEELEKNQDQIRRLRHDLNNQLIAVGNLLDEGNDAEAKRYFQQLSSYIQSGSRSFCKNRVVNAVLNAKYNLIQEERISEFFHISIDNLLSIDDISLCTIFANTLDNAIEACRKLPQDKRNISVKARYSENGYFSYEIVNTKCNEVKVKKDRFLSDKDDGDFHGIGLSSVKEVVQRYQGTIDVSFTEEEFKVVILIG